MTINRIAVHTAEKPAATPAPPDLVIREAVMQATINEMKTKIYRDSTNKGLQSFYFRYIDILPGTKTTQWKCSF